MTLDHSTVGNVYSRLVQVGPEFSTPKPGRGVYIYAVCLCQDCKEHTCVHVKHLQSGATRRCNTCRTNRPKVKHGMYGRKEYRVWDAMIGRCHRSKTKKYKYYGGRGLVVCDRWRYGEDGKSGFECFFADMGPRPSGDFTIEREDNDKGYNPTNCVWADRATNARNTSRTVLVTYKGKTQCLMDWSHELGIHPATLGRRHRLGWPLEELMSPPRHRITKGEAKK